MSRRRRLTVDDVATACRDALERHEAQMIPVGSVQRRSAFILVVDGQRVGVVVDEIGVHELDRARAKP
jgi:hypothetical protein